ncbi:hypothetical protein SeMB42_g02330 [Synchytrium endobioticum]|uniref:General transcription and DNA repair factor IIH n=1 Tax=Synchytrium endobioticum TaxID=286115 RepID=A0A507D5B3_9FUNG|nr:hypothetical protein SeLEV6574_g03120 [Synchytrium endobioticum]TPX50221.1 hypothetical protein SeMB42_g02330 [Synchytrium endobioticum]
MNADPTPTPNPDDDDAAQAPASRDAAAAPSKHAYVWEGAYEMSWQQIQEDDQGSLRSAISSLLSRKRKRPPRDTTTVRRGIIRHVYIILDQSRCMIESDLKPSRIEACIALSRLFIQEFFDQNPLSQIGIIGTRDATADKITELSGNPSEHLTALDDDKANKDEAKKKERIRDCRGEASLQNALELARVSLGHVPTHGSREILILFGSLATVDPASIFDTMDALVSDKIRVSIIGLSAEVHELVMKNIPPPVLTADSAPANMVEMGFPQSFVHDKAVLCCCHPRPVRRGFKCPRCDAIVCELPTDCPICSLPLVSSPLLARSYHHLFPVPDFREVEYVQVHDWTSARCFACVQPFEAPVVPSGTSQTKRELVNGLVSDQQPNGTTDIPTTTTTNGPPAGTIATNVFECPNCLEKFCSDCESFIHETLHICPACQSRGTK